MQSEFLTELYFIVSRLDWISIIDILLVTLVFFWILTLLQGTQAVQLLRGILVVSILAVISASVLNQLTAFSWLVNKSLPALLVAIPIIFQPELRRTLERLGRSSRFLTGGKLSTQLEASLHAVSQAAAELSGQRHGALIVYERETGLQDYIDTGIPLNAAVTPNLLMTIFFPGTALHDGAVIIKTDKILVAAAVLPLGGSTAADNLSLGTRHRAALGVTEATDAIAVVVSEETGQISLAYNGELIRGVDQKRLEQLLKAFFRNQLDDAIPSGLRTSQTVLRRLGRSRAKSGKRKTQGRN
ncbi:MAG: diadenylate cyclase CdaA [Anaerolineae bacterium]